MKINRFLLILSAAGLAACSQQHYIEVSNDSSLDRNAEIVSVPLSSITDAIGVDDSFVITDADGAEVPYQITYDKQVIFPATVAAGVTARYSIAAGTPAPVDTLATGALYAWRLDDLTWENDHSAYRAYGPGLQAAGEHAYGYDLWTKSVAEPVVAERYRLAPIIEHSLHRDLGNGMDVYAVGPTLGGGTGAIIAGDTIQFPWAFESHEILDNGPLRFAVRLTYPERPDGLREVRTITLDAGAPANRTEILFEGATEALTYAPGIVVHGSNPEAYVFDADRGVMTYSDLSQAPDDGNGIIFVGVVAPAASGLVYMPLPEARGDAIGHILAMSTIEPGTPYTYYWGSDWSKGGMPDAEAWQQTMAYLADAVAAPLQATVK